MLSILASKRCFFYTLLLVYLIGALATSSQAQNKTGRTARKVVYSKYCLVPPPPPYVPSMLPEMTPSRGYWHNYYSSCGSSHNGSAQTFKPNKYITYCVSNKT